MLAARRDPILGHGAQDAALTPSAGHAGGHAAARPTGFSRVVAGLQILGTVLGIPIGLASGYSIYRSTFSPEATCGSLRANIISMLDKNADASTLRLLVRKDVASFEHSCAAVDPDAVAAFRTLLAKPPAVAVAKEAKPARPAKEVKEVVHPAPAERAARAQRPEPEKRVAAKTAAPAAESKPANADADWLAAVRQALVEHTPVVRAEAAEAPAALTPPPAVLPMGNSLPAPAQVHAAPPLPPATSVANAPAPHSDDNHPVPPALIPNVGPPSAH